MAASKYRRSFSSRILSATFAAVNRLVPWHRLPVVLGAFNLFAFRDALREKNLYDTNTPSDNGNPKEVPPPTPHALYARTDDGSFNSLEDPRMGCAGTRFGRNMPLDSTFPEEGQALLSPNPRAVSRKLLTREKFIPATTLNLLASAWIQFQVHDWFAHSNSDGSGGDDFLLELEGGDPWGAHESDPAERNHMRIHRTARDTTRCPADAGRPPTYLNRNSQWWDGSAVYGCDAKTLARMRTGEGGKLKVDEKRRLPIDPDTGIAVSGFTDNWWIGLALMHTLFTLEHNAICESLKLQYPFWDDEQLYHKARLINSALMAKIHTLDWTPAILGHPTLQVGMQANWYGAATKYIYKVFGRLGTSEGLSGIPGSPVNHHAVPFSFTEEFVSVYRMHPLIPDDIEIYSLAAGGLLKSLTFPEVAFRNAANVIDDKVAVEDVFYSFGISHPGAITLHNYPRFLQELTKPDGTRLDLGAIDILRDRERGVPRYNEFRRHLRMPRVKSFEKLTKDKRWAREIKEMYNGDIDRVDLMVGLFAENPPKGFGFSDTAFRIFLLMASRRLKSDRYFTDDYTPTVYTQMGMDWINNNDMTSVLLRHYPELTPALRGVKNPFAPWNRVYKDSNVLGGSPSLGLSENGKQQAKASPALAASEESRV
jgi:Animal haem peroxidase